MRLPPFPGLTRVNGATPGWTEAAPLPGAKCPGPGRAGTPACGRTGRAALWPDTPAPPPPGAGCAVTPPGAGRTPTGARPAIIAVRAPMARLANLSCVVINPFGWSVSR